ncbi:MAG: pyridoxal phosphate-dependent aminotransferase [Bacteroidales bacterium]|nr:pyridoxal phosphate-dependent aminotransferase [Bacteroidales bacterium]
MKEQIPIAEAVVADALRQTGITDMGRASIRENAKIVNIIERATGVDFIRMEMGIPGLPAAPMGVQGQIDALKKGVASLYPPIEGIPDVKREASRFVKLFLDIDVSPEGCVPTCGSMQGGMTAFMMTGRCQAGKTHTLFIDPGFPVQKQQHRVLGIPFYTFDVYDFRGDRLREKLESYLKRGDISAIVYSNPNNPSWICLTDKELRIIAELADQYDAIVIEDLAYMGMDFRKDYSKPGQPPFQPTVAKYTDNYILMISGSKIFSYAGERIAFLAISDAVFARRYPDLKRYYASDAFGHEAVYGALYAISSGTSHSAQYALAAMLKAVNDGTYNFVEHISEYREKAHIMKRLFTENGFRIVYDKDEDEPLSDGFYFTISYPGLSGSELLKELLYYGISAIALSICGSDRTEGLRACVSLPQRSQFPAMEQRLRIFRQNHPVK